jgi:hypothetical protein
MIIPVDEGRSGLDPTFAPLSIDKVATKLWDGNEMEGITTELRIGVTVRECNKRDGDRER